MPSTTPPLPAVLGLGLGQLLVGPLSDALGRRRPIIAGLVAHGVASVLCATAPDVGTLIAVRVLQGLAGAAVSVVVMAAVRDLFPGRAAAGVLSRPMLLMGTAPLIAPSIGGLVLEATSWRGIFLILAVAASLLAVSVSLGLPETLPPARRRSAHPRQVARAYRTLLSDRVFRRSSAHSAERQGRHGGDHHNGTDRGADAAADRRPARRPADRGGRLRTTMAGRAR